MLSAAAPAASSVSASTDDALQWQQDAAHDGNAAGDTIDPATLTQLWSKTLPNQVLQPLIVDGRVIVIDGHEMNAYDAGTGALLWGPTRLQEAPGPLVGAVAGDGVVVVESTWGSLQAWDAATGAEVWSHQLGQASMGGIPTVADGVLYVHSENGTLDEFRMSDGALLLHKGNVAALYGFQRQLAVDDGQIFTFGSGGSVVSLDAKTGAPRWSHPLVGAGTAGEAAGTSAVWAGRVYAPTGPPEVLDEATGADVAGSFADGFAPAFGGDTGFFTDFAGQLTARSLSTQQDLWSVANVGLPPLTANGHVFVALTSATAEALDPTTGSVQWQATLPAPPTTTVPTAMAIGESLLAVPAGTSLTVFGDPAVTRPTVTPPTALPTIVPGHLPPVLGGVDDAQFAVDGAHDNAQLAETMTSPLTPAWSVATDGSPGQPLVTDDGVFFVVGQRDAGGNASIELVGLDLHGNPLWAPVALPTLHAWGTPAFLGHTVVITTDTSTSGVSTATGALLWSRRDLPQAVPMVSSGKLYLDGDQVDPGTGEVTAHAAAPDIGLAGATDGKNLYLTAAEFALLKYDATLNELWERHDYDAGGGGAEIAAVHAGELFSRSAGAFDGTFSVWNGDHRDYFPVTTLPAFDGLVTVLSNDDGLQAVDMCSHRTYWSHASAAAPGYSPLIANGLVYSLQTDGHVEAVDETSGNTVWTADAGGPVLSTPPFQDDTVSLNGLAVGHGLLLVPTEGRLTAYAGTPTTPTTQPTPPDQPGITAVTHAAGGLLHIAWSAVASNDARGATQMLLHIAPEGLDIPLDACTTHLDLPGLDPTIAHHVTLTAVNAMGSSARAVADLAGLPQPATSVAGLAGDAAAAVQWVASESDAPVTGYIVTAHPGGQSVSVGPDATSAVVPGLVNGVAYTFTVVATSSVGDSADSVASAAVVPAARTTLGISNSRTLTAYTVTQLSGRLSQADGAVVSGAAVTLYRRAAGASAYTALGHAVTSSTGTWSVSVRPTSTTRYYATFAGSSSARASRSATMTLSLRPRVTVTSPKTGADVTAGTIVVSGRTVGVHRGVKVVLQLRGSDGRWHSIASALVGSRGVISEHGRLARGSHLLRLRVAATSATLAGWSAAVRVRAR